MKRIFLFMLPMAFSMGAQAYNVNIADTVCTRHREYFKEKWETVQPSYLTDVVSVSTWKDNWFLSVSGGTSAFLGSPLGCEDLFGRMKPTLAVSAGKWFTPAIGGRLSYQGFRFKDSRLETQSYQFCHADLLWNVLAGLDRGNTPCRWSLIPYAGAGIIHHKGSGHHPFALSYGIQGRYRLTDRFHLLAELGGTTTFKDFDGYGASDQFGDNLVGLTAGISFTIGKVGWRKVIDPVPYIRQNEELAVHALCLAGKNRGLQKNNAMNLAIIAELKKILELEGLLDRYADKLSELVGNAESQTASSGYPRNNYSGLNSLRARLRQPPLGEASDSAFFTHPSTYTSGESVSQGRAIYNLDNRLASSVSDGLYVGAPIYFFFILNTHHLTDTSQLINLDGVARIANKYGLYIRVSGAADNATGNETINSSLGLSRAEYIKEQLIERSVPSSSIEIISEGGIDVYSPNEANRNACVRLFAPQNEG
jgi:outer membrane protein OmpA-like peptidoglycan-associated protein